MNKKCLIESEIIKMTEQEKLQNTVDCIEVYAKSLERSITQMREEYNETKSDPYKLAKRLDVYLDSIRYETEKLVHCYVKLCDKTNYDSMYFD